MQIIPVMDLKGGFVVHAVRGRRENYRPVKSRLAANSKPGEIAAALASWGFADVYVADLDAIASGKPNEASVDEICAAGLRVWLDAGIHNARQMHGRVGAVVLGLESLSSLAELDELVAALGSDSLIFSLDHRAGVPITRASQWQNATISHIACEVARRGLHRFLDLDLARVGSGQGPRESRLVEQLRSVSDQVFVALGGGVRSIRDVAALAEYGYDAVLVATALHDGSLSADDVRPFIRRGKENSSPGRAFPKTP
jgi:phosphoribosylformimino-5-aminoimidazole carboxamide ribotide isomerase